MDISVDRSIVDHRIKFFICQTTIFMLTDINIVPPSPVLYGHTTY